MRDKSTRVIIQKGAPFGGIALIMYIGAATYFVQQSNGFFGFVWALVKALVWPGILIHNVLALIHA